MSESSQATYRPSLELAKKNVLRDTPWSTMLGTSLEVRATRIYREYRALTNARKILSIGISRRIANGKQTLGDFQRSRRRMS